MFKIGDEVKVVSDGSIGIVKNIRKFDSFCVYEVLVNSKTQSFFESQIEMALSLTEDRLTADGVKAKITQTLLNNVDNKSLYSINSAKIDYIPYQFRPVLKIIKSDLPRILIADGVGVGKTIESGLIINELQARTDIKSILIICPKPLITENKWAQEMERFGCKFTNLDGKLLNQCIVECNKDGVWPEQYSKCIIPYSLFDENLVFGTKSKKGKKIGLLDLMPFPKFDLVIVDEAHHIRNSQTNRYHGVKMFLDNCESAILLSATPLQMGDKDLYTLLNLLRPDLVIDYDTFKNMAEPNQYISLASKTIRKNISNWQMIAVEELEDAKGTTFGKAIYSIDPNYKEAMRILHKKNISAEERVLLIDYVEKLHTFSSIINRTRRRDIGAFTIRKVQTVLTEFTNEEIILYEKFITFVAEILIALHGNKCIKFMMTTLLRQASSSLHALAPFMKDILNKKIIQLNYSDNEDLSEDELESTFSDLLKFSINNSSYNEIISMSEKLPLNDNKILALLNIIDQKNLMLNNKVIVFSSFKHTLDYIHNILIKRGIRSAIIHGGIPDDERASLRSRFKQRKEEKDSIDVLLFSDVGCEGLDYQFCDCLVNYDMPWNPQKIEQRIGRIDKKGQKSESVLIYNMVVKNTIDEEIYNRCLSRIEVFNSQIGDSEEIVGALTQEINDIAIKYILSPQEAREKLNQLSDNTIRIVLEQQKLEDSQYDFFGLDVATKKMDKDVEDAKNVFLSEEAILNLINDYFNKLQIKNAIIKQGDKFILKLSKSDREKLYIDFLKIERVKNRIYNIWEALLKTNDFNIYIDFNGERSSEDSNSLFINIAHPLVKQAILNIDTSNDITYIKTQSNKIKPGIYPFEIYLWSYSGLKNTSKLKVITHDNIQDTDFLNLLFDSEDCEELLPFDNSLEIQHYKQWIKEKERYVSEVSANIEYKKQTISNSYDKRIFFIEDNLAKANDERIIRMKTSELNNCKFAKNSKITELDKIKKCVDILSTRVIRGVLKVEI